MYMIRDLPTLDSLTMRSSPAEPDRNPWIVASRLLPLDVGRFGICWRGEGGLNDPPPASLFRALRLVAP
jgi:hypothetical protein